MRSINAFALCYTSAYVLLIAVVNHQYGARSIPVLEMAAERGGFTQIMKCSETCNHYNGRDLPCDGKDDGDICQRCSADPDVLYYVAQKSTPLPPNCESKTKGFKSDPNNAQQGCGFSSTGTCNGLVCEKLQPGATPCKAKTEIVEQ